MAVCLAAALAEGGNLYDLFCEVIEKPPPNGARSRDPTAKRVGLAALDFDLAQVNANARALLAPHDHVPRKDQHSRAADGHVIVRVKDQSAGAVRAPAKDRHGLCPQTGRVADRHIADQARRSAHLQAEGEQVAKDGATDKGATVLHHHVAGLHGVDGLLRMAGDDRGCGA